MIGAVLSSGLVDSIQSMSFVLANGEAGAIVGPIAKVLSVLYNAIFNGIYSFAPGIALGVAIILFTVIIKGAFSPLSYMQVKSTKKMQEIQPKINAIQAKYKNATDRESQLRMQQEIQKVQRESGVNLLAGCLPLLVQLPILYALYHVFQHPYMYLDVIAENYSLIADALMDIDVGTRVNALYNIAVEHKLAIDLAVKEDLVKLVNVMTADQWENVFMAVGKEAANLRALFDKKLFIETFLGINLIYKTGVSFPGIIIPIASGVTTFLTSRATSDNQPQDPNDPTAGMMKSMNYVMPAIMAIMAGTVPAAVGLYWVISNLIQFVIQKVVGFVYDRNKEKAVEKERQASIKLMEDRINSKNAGKRK